MEKGGLEMATNPKQLLQLLYENEKHYADIIYLRQPRDGKYRDFTWKDTMYQARKVASFLKAQGLNKGDCVSILSKNCAEWIIADCAIMMAGCISVPLYATQHRDTIEYVLNHAEVKIIFIGKLDEPEKQEAGIPDEIVRVDFPYPNSMRLDFKWNNILRDYAPMQDNYIPELDDIYTIMYTSGTTGNPKGVVHTYKVASDTIESFAKEIAAGIWDLPEHNYLLSYLPLAHVAERMGIVGISLTSKSTVSFVESIDTFPDNLRETAPTLFFAVPRIWDIFKNGILDKLPERRLQFLLKLPILSMLIKKKVKKSLGLHRSRMNISGAAPISPSTLSFFYRLDIQILEGYGQTENCAIATLSPLDDYKPGSVGKARFGVGIKIGENSELLIKSPGDMAGYYMEPELTKEVFTEDGYLRTGDMGRVDEDGYVYIIGRVKDQFKTDKGEYVCPVSIESDFGNNVNVEQLCLIGTNLVQPVMLVTLSEIGRGKSHDTVTKELLETLEELNPKLTKYEKISHVIVTPEEWTVENELLTPTLKIKRREVELRFHDFAQREVKGEDQVIWYYEEGVKKR